MKLSILFRIIVSGPMMDVVVPNSAQVFRYDQVYQLDQDILKKVRQVYYNSLQSFIITFSYALA